MKINYRRIDSNRAHDTVVTVIILISDNIIPAQNLSQQVPQPHLLPVQLSEPSVLGEGPWTRAPPPSLPVPADPHRSRHPVTE
jgi:hypothetical protein